MSQNVVSAKLILSRVSRLFRPTDAQWMHDAIESIDEGVQALGTKALGTFIADLHASNFRAALPCDLEYVNWVEVDGERVFVNNDIGIVSPTFSSPSFSGYKIDAGYIKTPKAKCNVRICFDGIPRDEEGLPLVPKDFEAIESVFWLVVSHMILQGYTLTGMTYEKAEYRATEWRGKAVNAMMMPTPDEIETLSHVWLGTKQIDYDKLFASLEAYPITTNHEIA